MHVHMGAPKLLRAMTVQVLLEHACRTAVKCWEDCNRCQQSLFLRMQASSRLTSVLSTQFGPLFRQA